MKKYLYIILVLGCLTTVVRAEDFTFKPQALSVGVQPGYGWLMSNHNSVKSTGAFSLGYGFSYNHRFSRTLGLSVGLTNRHYTGNFDMTGFRDSVHMTDEDGHDFYFHQRFNSVEKNEVNYLELGAKLNIFAPVSESAEFFISIGASYGIPTLQRTTMTGSYQRYLDFYNDHVIVR